MIIGFTGTRFGMTGAQKGSLRGLLRSFQMDSWDFKIHHGDCVGADDEFVDIACEVYRCLVHVVCHPPVDVAHRAYNTHVNETLPPLTHFARNRAIVDAVELLIACPREMSEQKTGGTWYTVTYARKRKRGLIIIWPDGTMAAESVDLTKGKT